MSGLANILDLTITDERVKNVLLRGVTRQLADKLFVHQ